MRRKRVGWVEGGVVVVVTEGRGGGGEGTIGGGACSQLARVEVILKQRGERGTEKEEREKKEVKNKVSIHKEM